MLVTKKQRDSHQALSIPAKITVVACLLLLFITGVLLILGAFVIGFISLLKITGTQYNSLSTLMLFFIVFFIIAFIVDFISIFSIKLFSEQIRSSKKKFIIRLIINWTFTWLAIYTADELINSVSIPLIIEFIAVLLLFLLEVFLDLSPKNTKSKKRLEL